jgi:hypothetical protein
MASQLKLEEILYPTSTTPAITINADNSVTIPTQSTTTVTTTGNVTVGGTLTVGGGTLSPQTGFKNRIINGRMTIDQRNAGASVTQNTSGQFSVDRWNLFGSVTSKFTIQQNAGAVTPPAGFANYLGITSLSAYTVGTSELFIFGQKIEGFNVADLAWGTASASPITLSFLVRSSLTGTFGGSFRNSNGTRSYPFVYTIGSANTWTTISVTIPGDTSGTWQTGSSTGFDISFNLGTGTTFSGTAGSWSGSNFVSATGATSVVGTNGATFYITGVQLERGSTATPFEFRSIGDELALCQRYFAKTFNQSVAPAQNAGTDGALVGTSSVTNVAFGSSWWFPVTMRAVPTIVTFAPDAASANWSDQAGSRPTAALTSIGQSNAGMRGTGAIAGGGYYTIHMTASIEL